MQGGLVLLSERSSPEWSILYFCISFAGGVTLLFILNYSAARNAGKALPGTITFAGLAMLLVLFEGARPGRRREDCISPSLVTAVEIRLYTTTTASNAPCWKRLQPVITDLVRRYRSSHFH
jgi:hypothetical protein